MSLVIKSSLLRPVQYYKKAKIRRDIYFSFEESFDDNLSTQAPIITAEIDLVEVAIFFLIALAHHQVAVRDWQANSEPVASRDIPPLEARFRTGSLS